MESSNASATCGGKVIVRPALPQELGEAAKLFDAYRQFYGMASELEAALAFLSDRMARDESAVLLAFTSDEECPAIGFAQLYRSFSSLELAPIVVLNDLFVTPRWRRLGAARALVRAAEEYARLHGATRLELATQSTNRDAQRLYHSLGWVEDREFIHLSLQLTPNTLSSRIQSPVGRGAAGPDPAVPLRPPGGAPG
jgi:GNAT superfamily N-acetyltransferase